jgi:hypothetical protein
LDYAKFNISPRSPEKIWRDALAKAFDGWTEVKINGGRIDVMTVSEVIEIDFIHKWHEGLGQALHYADATGKEGVLALICIRLDKKTQAKLDLILWECERHEIQLLILLSVP